MAENDGLRNKNLSREHDATKQRRYRLSDGRNVDAAKQQTRRNCKMMKDTTTQRVDDDN